MGTATGTIASSPISRAASTMLDIAFLLFLLPVIYIQHGSFASASAAGKETLVGIVGRDFVVLGADSSASSSIALTSSTVDKIALVSDPSPFGPRTSAKGDSWSVPIAVAAAGDAADVDRLTSVLAAHCGIREYESGVGCDVEVVYNRGSKRLEGWSLSGARGGTAAAGLDVASVAQLARGEIASSLRSGRGRLNLCLLVAGMVWRATEPCYGDRRSHTHMVYDGDDPTFSGRVRRQVEAAEEEYGRSRGKAGGATSEEGQTASLRVEKSLEEGDKDDGDISKGMRESQMKTPPDTLIPRLFWLDEYGSLQNLEYGAHGMGANFALSILDRGYHPDLTREDAVRLIRDCFDQLRTRFVINSPRPPCIKCIDANGCQLV